MRALHAASDEVDWNIQTATFAVQLLPRDKMRVRTPVRAAVSLLFWVQDAKQGYVPLGSISSAICVSDPGTPCPGEPIVVEDLEGPQLLSVARQVPQVSLADAALTFVEAR